MDASCLRLLDDLPALIWRAGVDGGGDFFNRRWLQFTGRTLEQEYGYGWWIRDIAGYRAFNAWGYGGQFIFVVPDLELVVVTTSSTDTEEARRGHRRTVMDVVERFVVPAVAASGTR